MHAFRHVFIMHARMETYIHQHVYTYLDASIHKFTHALTCRSNGMHTYITNMCIHALMQAYTNSQSHLNVGLHSWVTYSYAYTRMYIQAHTLIPKRIDPCIYPYTHTYRHADIHACMQHAYIHTYIHTCMHAYIHTYLHANFHGYTFELTCGLQFSCAFGKIFICIHTCSYRLIDLHLLASIHPSTHTDRQTDKRKRTGSLLNLIHHQQGKSNLRQLEPNTASSNPIHSN